jgi:hypothetical protein
MTACCPRLTASQLWLSHELSQSQNHIATDGQSVSLGVEPHLGLMTRYFLTVWQLRSCFCGVLSLTRGYVCFLYMLLVLSSAVFLGFESQGTRDHNLLSQIWDFPFRRLLRLAGSRWVDSTPPPDGGHELWVFTAPYIEVRVVSTEIPFSQIRCHEYICIISAQCWNIPELAC